MVHTPDSRRAQSSSVRRRDEFITFFDLRVDDVLSKAGGGLADAVQRLAPSSLASGNEESLAATLAARFELEVPHLDFDAMTVEQGTTMVPAEHFPATYFVRPGKSYEKKTVVFRIPYRGDPTFLRCYDATRSMNPARVFRDGEDVCFEVLSLSFDRDEIERDRDATLLHLQRFLPPVARAVEMFNDGLHGRALNLIRARKKEIAEDSELLASLGTPVAQSSGPPPTLAVAPPVKRRVIGISKTAATPGHAPDPTLDDGTYDDILDALSTYGRQMERAPSTYTGLGEEDIRNHLLALLQAGFRSGSATGESFNRSGKTDLLLRHENETLFVAECKIWTGPSALLTAVSQLLGYLTWRDSKAALVLFVRNKDISKVLDSIAATTPTHDHFVSLESVRDGVFRTRFKLPDDGGVRVRLAILAFHVPGK